MLHWLAGQKPPEGQPDINASTYEPPETPAPVFAVRAFKHAIFGTPQTTQPTVRRHSNTDHARPRPTASRAERPPLARPKSAGDANALRGVEDFLVPDPAPSPTKGILLTPGTAAAKRKTVSFGDGVIDNETKRPVKNGLPDDFADKYPDPWISAPPEDASDEPAPIARRKSKLTESLEQARRDSTKRKSKVAPRDRSPEFEKAVEDEDELPLFDCCRVWKAQYDIYRERSQREIKKLITKHKAAKSFAKDKDFQCTDLADQLRIEKKKVDKLEKRTAELEEQIKAMRAQLGEGNHVRQDTRPSNAAARLSEPIHAESAVVTSTDVPSPLPKPDAINETAIDAVTAPIVAEAALPTPAPQPLTDLQLPTSRVRIARVTEQTKPVTQDDIWNQSIRSSSLAVPAPSEARALPARTARAAVSSSIAAPLKTLNINAIPAAKLTRRDSTQPSPPMDRFAKEPLILQEVIPSSKSDPAPDVIKDKPMILPSHRQQQAINTRTTSPIRREREPPDQTRASAIPTATPSRPFDSDPLISPPPGRDPKPFTFERQPTTATKTSNPSTVEPERPTSTIPPTMIPTIETERPPQATEPVQPENLKPTAAWSAISGPQAGKRLSSLTDKQGREVDQARIEAARARMAMRGRALP